MAILQSPPLSNILNQMTAVRSIKDTFQITKRDSDPEETSMFIFITSSFSQKKVQSEESSIAPDFYQMIHKKLFPLFPSFPLFQKLFLTFKIIKTGGKSDGLRWIQGVILFLVRESGRIQVLDSFLCQESNQHLSHCPRI